jgi:hypothetical protein
VVYLCRYKYLREEICSKNEVVWWALCGNDGQFVSQINSYSTYLNEAHFYQIHKGADPNIKISDVCEIKDVKRKV